ncbi:MAG: hypothetical protein ABSB78_13510 [Bacteroidota bacterium]
MNKVLFSLVFPCNLIFAQVELSISFDQFSQEVGNIFSPDQIAFVRERLPLQHDIYGFAIGDFSGDYLPDLAISVRTKELKGKKMKVYYFVSDEEQLLEVRRNILEFYDVPIEIGFTIENGICYTTQKKGRNYWTIRGYTYREGNFFLVDSYESTRKYIRGSGGSEVGYETTTNYRTLSTSEHYYSLGGEQSYLDAHYYTFPAYPIERNIHPFLYYVVRDTAMKYIISGKEYWSGRFDAGFESAAFYDDAFLYVFAWVIDDTVETRSQQWEECDHVQLWFDLNETGKLTNSKTTTPNFRVIPDDDVLMVAIAPGNSEEDQQRVKVIFRSDTITQSVSEYLSQTVRQDAINEIRVLADRTIDGYALRIRIPFGLFGGIERLHKPIGYSLVLHDVDGHDSTAQVTELATSLFREWNPSTFGVLRLMFDNNYYGEVIDLNMAEMIRKLSNVGIDVM